MTRDDAPTRKLLSFMVEEVLQSIQRPSTDWFGVTDTNTFNEQCVWCG